MAYETFVEIIYARFIAMGNRHTQRMKFPRLRELMTGVWLLVGAMGQAQSTTTDHRFSMDQDLDPVTEKLVHQVVNDLDPKGRVAVDGRMLKARMHSDVTSETLLAALNELNAGTFVVGWPVTEVAPSPMNNGNAHGPNGNPMPSTDVPKLLVPTNARPASEDHGTSTEPSPQ